MQTTSGWLWTEVTSLLTAVQDLKIVSLILAAGSALGKG
jgi:choline dehydrogenase